MPIYEYACRQCDNQFELLVRSDEDEPKCPRCGGKRVVKQFSVAATHLARGRQLPVCGARAEGGCCRAECGGGQCPLD